MSKNNLKIYTWLDDHGSWRHGIHLKFFFLFAKRSFVLWRSIHIQDACHFDALTYVYSNWHMGEMCGTYDQNNDHLNAPHTYLHTHSFWHNFFYSILEQCEGKNKITMLNIVCSKLGIVYLTLLEKVQILRREYLF